MSEPERAPGPEWVARVVQRLAVLTGAGIPAASAWRHASAEGGLGAIVDGRQFDRVMAYIEAGRREGATLRAGGQAALGGSGGWFVQPTIFECPSQALTIVREEIFGPVLAVTVFDTEDDVVRMANDSPYGLGAGLWTSDLSRAHRVSRKLRSGLVWVNCYMDGDITVPFGGVKQSGFGRDKSLHALEKYQDLKTTWIRLGD